MFLGEDVECVSLDVIGGISVIAKSSALNGNLMGCPRQCPPLVQVMYLTQEMRRRHAPFSDRCPC